MKSDLTIVLLLKDRQEFNKRFISFFLKNNINYNLLISDGGKKKIDNKLLDKIKKNKLIKYLKFPEDKTYDIFYKKIYKTLKKVRTKYIIFSANDDFFVYKTLGKCLNFLNNNKNKGYIGAGGTMIGFKCSKNKRGFSKMQNFHYIYKYIKLDQKNNLIRFNNYIKNFNDIPRNSIMDKKILLDIYKYSVNLFKNNIEFKDHFTNLLNIIQGRIKIFNNPLILHETHSASEGNFRSKILLSVFKNENFLNDLSKFDKILSKKLNVNKNYVINKYYKYVLSQLLNALTLKNEPSIKQIRSIIFKKFQRKVLNNNLKKEIYINKENLNKNTKDIINIIENDIIN